LASSNRIKQLFEGNHSVSRTPVCGTVRPPKRWNIYKDVNEGIG
jgi:hypothetical protein